MDQVLGRLNPRLRLNAGHPRRCGSTSIPHPLRREARARIAHTGHSPSNICTTESVLELLSQSRSRLDRRLHQLTTSEGKVHELGRGGGGGGGQWQWQWQSPLKVLCTNTLFSKCYSLRLPEFPYQVREEPGLREHRSAFWGQAAAPHNITRGLRRSIPMRLA